MQKERRSGVFLIRWVFRIQNQQAQKERIIFRAFFLQYNIPPSEKRNVTALVGGALIIAAYCIYAFTGNGPGAAGVSDLKTWAGAMLVFIGIGIGLAIVLQILFHIVLSVSVAVREQSTEKEIGRKIEAEMVEDEMDKLIELKSSRVGWAVASAGFIAALFSLVFGGSAALMINMMFLSAAAGSMVGGFISIFYYRKGVRNG